MANPFDTYGTVSGSGQGFKARTGGGEFAQLKQKIADAVLDIKKQVNTLRQLSFDIGTPSDSERLRIRIDNVRHSTLEHVTSVSSTWSLLFQLAQTSEDELAARNVLGKMEKAMKDFEAINEEIVERLRNTRQPLPEDNASSNAGFMDSGELHVTDDRAKLIRSPVQSGGETHLLDDEERQQQQLLREEQEQAALNRAERMRDIESNIVAIHEIMQDLHNLVQVQGEDIDTIERNVEEGYSRVLQGNRELSTAVKLKKCSRRLTCLIAIIVIAVLIVIAIVIAILVSVLKRDSPHNK